MIELLQSASDILFYVVVFGLAIYLNNDGGGGKRSWMPIG